jgi:regulator of replication initiation timing
LLGSGNAQLREAAKSSSDQLQQVNRLAAEVWNENTSLKEELKKLKKKLKEEQESKLRVYAETDKKEGALRKSIESLLSKIYSPRFTSSFPYDIFVVVMNYFSQYF